MLCSCSTNQKIPEISAASDADAVVCIDGKQYACHITYVNSSTARITYTKPEGISGIVFSRTESDYSVSLGGLVCRNSGDPCRKGVSQRILRMFDGITKGETSFISVSEDGVYEFSGKCEDGEYRIYTDSTGKISEISSDDTIIEIV